jgi:hypothetical protein
VTVDVTSATAGANINTVAANDLVTNNGNNAGPASATLTVVAPATAVPALNQWGVILFVLLAGLGSVYYLRKYRKV